MTADSHPGETVTATPHRRSPFPLIAGASVFVLVVAALAFIVVRQHGSRQQAASLNSIRPSGIPASVSTSIANLMGLSPVPAKQAPAFVLTDQNGRTMSLASLRGNVVVLEAMDPHCVDICPIVSQEFVDAYHDLGPTAHHVVFAAINVNRYFEGVSSVATFSRDHQLDTIPSWHFFTGTTPKLTAAWSAYGIQVQVPNPNADIIHTSIIYFIGPNGVERYVASPMIDRNASGQAYLPASQLTSWGQGIALTATQLASSS